MTPHPPLPSPQRGCRASPCSAAVPCPDRGPPGTRRNAAPRCAATVRLPGPNLVVSNVHLCGGRFDDPQYRALLDVKAQQLAHLVRTVAATPANRIRRRAHASGHHRRRFQRGPRARPRGAQPPNGERWKRATFPAGRGTPCTRDCRRRIARFSCGSIGRATHFWNPRATCRPGNTLCTYCVCSSDPVVRRAHRQKDEQIRATAGAPGERVRRPAVAASRTGCTYTLKQAVASSAIMACSGRAPQTVSVTPVTPPVGRGGKNYTFCGFLSCGIGTDSVMKTLHCSDHNAVLVELSVRQR